MSESGKIERVEQMPVFQLFCALSLEVVELTRNLIRSIEHKIATYGKAKFPSPRYEIREREDVEYRVWHERPEGPATSIINH